MTISPSRVLGIQRLSLYDRLPEITMLIFLLSVMSCAAGSVGYFLYGDCDVSCQHANVSCTISEVSPYYFPCDCIENDNACLDLASDDVVCLRKDKEVSGGKNIWRDYQKHMSTTTTARPLTTTTRKPDHHAGINLTTLTLSVVFGVSSFLSLSIHAVQLFQKRRSTNQSYERIRTPDNPYQDTIEEVQPTTL